jgi:ribosome-associated protein
VTLICKVYVLMSNYPQELDTLLHLLAETQASDIVVLDVKNLTSVTDYMIITTGRSARNVKAIAEGLLEQPKGLLPRIMGVSGMESGEWVLVDFGDFILHIMQDETRKNYNLEALWQGKTSYKPHDISHYK